MRAILIAVQSCQRSCSAVLLLMIYQYGDNQHAFFGVSGLSDSEDFRFALIYCAVQLKQHLQFGTDIGVCCFVQ